jgi:hypothetical protein
MAARLFTIISEFGGTTNVTQTTAIDLTHAVRAWAERLRVEAPFGLATAALSDTVERELPEMPPTPIEGAQGVWCLSSMIGDALLLAHVVETARG